MTNGSTGAPTIQPLTTWTELLQWKTPTDLTSQASVAEVLLAERPTLTGMSSLAGFDNGDWEYDPFFTEWSQGGTGQSDTRTAANVYNFSFWQYLDISYYFGHQFVIIPPTVWTNAAHANGVLSLGTLNLNDLSNDGIDATTVANQLIQIAKYYQFDGYCINDETGSDGDWDRQLMAQLRSNEEKDLIVIWYDSPLSGGYANELNQGAVPFLEAAGYFQTNYCWGSAAGDGSTIGPQNSLAVLKSSFPNDYGNWRNKVFSSLSPYCCGVNCAGCENCTQPYSGYFFENFKLLLQENGDYLTGIGVYAPAFTMYWCLQTKEQQLPDVMTFQNNDQAFWAGTTNYRNYKPTCDDQGTTVTPRYDQCMAWYIEPRTVILTTPFVTDFNTGEGTFFNIDGATAATNPWNNLSVQSLLPTWRYSQTVTPNFDIVLSYDVAYNGGSSLLVSLGSMQAGTSGIISLYQTGIKLTKTNQVTTVVQNTGSSFLPTLQLALYLDDIGIPIFIDSSSEALRNGWIRLTYEIPPQYAGRTFTVLALQVTNNSNSAQPIALAVGQLKILDTTQSGGTPYLGTFAPATVLSWKNVYNKQSVYRVYGVLEGKNYLLGIVRNYVYSTEGNILNTNQANFSSYVVQEVNIYGESTPV
jgi:mannosyl-glycoprotein endo-beta-N-acetylglucosaminidase